MVIKNKNNSHPLTLIVLDGWGLSIPSRGNAIALAKTPIFDKLWANNPHATLQASGETVGLPHGLCGNSEVGHIHLGAGRVVKQDLTIINESIADGTFFQNPVLLSAIQHARANGSRLHLMGMISDGGVHSDIQHLFALLEFTKKAKLGKEVYIHAFTDGQDTPPHSGLDYVEELENRIQELGFGQIATISGRYYAMDRAHNYDRSKLVYDAIVHGQGDKAKSAYQTLRRAYKKGITDEFIKPTVITSNSKPTAELKDRDVIIFFNLRSDRARQLTKPFVLHDFEAFNRNGHLSDIFFVGLTNFGDDLPMSIAFPDARVSNSLPEVLNREKNLRQLYIAEEEKYAHVTYFFHGGAAVRAANENWVMIPSLDIKTYDLDPRMAAPKVTARLIKELESDNRPDFSLVNFANPDMLGHTGNLKAAIKGVEYTDQKLGELLKTIKKINGQALIVADHGNCEEMIDLETGDVMTSHTTNPVPFIFFNTNINKKFNEGLLANIAPTILDLKDIPAPKEMTAPSLLAK